MIDFGRKDYNEAVADFTARLNELHALISQGVPTYEALEAASGEVLSIWNRFLEKCNMPVFVVLAKDALCPVIVDYYADKNRACEGNDPAVTLSALKHATLIRGFQHTAFNARCADLPEEKPTHHTGAPGHHER